MFLAKLWRDKVGITSPFVWIFWSRFTSVGSLKFELLSWYFYIFRCCVHPNKSDMAAEPNTIREQTLHRFIVLYSCGQGLIDPDWMKAQWDSIALGILDHWVEIQKHIGSTLQLAAVTTRIAFCSSGSGIERRWGWSISGFIHPRLTCRVLFLRWMQRCCRGLRSFGKQVASWGKIFRTCWN